jgi:hypothetical protein
VTPVGIRSIIELLWERSSPQRARDFAAPSRWAHSPKSKGSNPSLEISDSILPPSAAG